MQQTSYIELSKKALLNNIQYLKNRIGSDTRYSMVIKANAYGHGIDDILPMIEDCGVDHFAVFSAAEALEAYKVKKEQCEIMIMGWIDEDTMDWAIEHEVSFFVFTMNRLRKACERGKHHKKAARIHLELETGMYRTGLYERQLEEVVALIRDNPDCLFVEGLCTHYAGAENIANYSRIKEQIETFNRLCTWLHQQGITPKYRHTACSAAVLAYPQTVMDMARIGISSYGFWPSDEIKMSHMIGKNNSEDPLKRVLSWKSEVMSVQEVPEGHYISYGTSFRTNRDTVTATVPVGYGYGFSRNLSNLGHVLVQGKRVRVIGTVNMNMMLIDVTDLDNVQEGDEVVLIGRQREEEISVTSLGQMTNYLNYELLTRLPDDIPRYEVE